ncbi:S1 family peptidase [Aporhodopirellula aestuarii]|uniref:Serine protease n=1 Tax=Aporhodopirellula aestuarii TaxID=2950107 RepID=A0ABT0U8Z9_9BACT|nr:serine protease [Aporhodopirellula aestuarii]
MFQRIRPIRVFRYGVHRLFSRLFPALTLALATVVFASSTAMAEDSADESTNNYMKVLPSTVWIITANSENETSTGTGVFVDAKRRLVLTNAHVVGDSRSAVVFFPDIQNGQPAVKRKGYLDQVLKLAKPGKIVAVDRKLDLALIELAEVPQRAKAIEMATRSILPGEDVDLIGNPGGSDVLWVYTSGTVRSVYDKKFNSDHGKHEFKVVETQTPIKPGDSGGPVVNSQGKLVAIAQSFSPNFNLVSYCVDISDIKAFMDSPWKPAPLATGTLLKSADIEHTVHSTGHYQVEKKLNSGKTQTVFVSKDTEYFQRADIRKVWSLVSVSKDEPTSELLMRLMRQSSATKIGGWAVEKNTSDEYLVLYVAKLDATASDEALSGTIEYVARIAGAMNGQLKPKEEKTSSSETLAAWLSK